MRKVIVVLSVVVSCAVLPACSGSPAGSGATCSYPGSGSAAKQVDPPPTAGVPNSGTVPYTMRLNEDEVVVTLDREHAPCTVNSFVSLATQGYFDDTSCHRLVDGGGLYVLQCGDPTATGSGGPGYRFDDELTGSETYRAGTLAMANAGKGTNGSQFFIVYADSELPPNYTVFGRTDAAGTAVVAAIAAGGQDGSYPDGSGKPVLPALIRGVVAG